MSATDVIRAFLGHLCHQLPERSLAAGSEPMWLCARCTGLYAGVLAAAVVHARRARPARRERVPAFPLALVAACAALVAAGAADALWPGVLVAPSNGERLITGLGAGIGLSVAAFVVVAPHRADARRSEHVLLLLATALGGAAIAALALSGWPPAGRAVSWISAAGVLVLAWLVNAVVLARVIPSSKWRWIAAALVPLELVLVGLSPLRHGGG